MNTLSRLRLLILSPLGASPLAAQTPYPCSWAGGNGGDWLSFAWAPQPLDYIEEAGFPIPFPTWPDNDRAAGSGTFTYLVTVPNGRVNLGSGSVTVATLIVSSGAETRLRGATLKVEGYAGYGGSAVANDGLISLGDSATLEASSAVFLPSGLTVNGDGTVSLLDEASSIKGNVLDFGGSQLVRGAGKVGGAAGIGGVIPSTVINRGTFLADAPPLAMTVQGAAFENRGTARAMGGGFLKLRSLLTDNRDLIESQGGVVDFQDDDVDNSGTLRAKSGGNLQFKDQDVDNDGGLIEAMDAGSLVQLRGGVTIEGGTLRRVAPAQVRLQQGTNTFTGSLRVQGQLEVDATAGLRLQNLTLTGEAGTVFNPQPGAVIYSTGSVDLRGRLDGNGTWSFNAPLSLTGPLTLNNLQFDVGEGQPVNMTGATANNSIIRLLDAPGGANTRLLATDGASFAGTGQLRFATGSVNRLDPATTGAVFTNVAPHTITTEAGSNAIVTAALVNSGTTEVAGAGATMLIHNPALTNTGLLQARDGGFLRLNNSFGGTASYVFTNTAGTFRMGSGSTAQFEGNVLLRGGTVDGPGTLNLTGVTVFDSPQANPMTIADTNVVINEFQPFTVRGTLTNGGTLRLNDGTLVPNGVQGSAAITLDGNVTLNGNGRVLFNTPYANFINAPSGTTPVFTNGPGHTIASAAGGRGLIYPATVNAGLIEAVGPPVTGGYANVELVGPSLTNTGVISSRDSGYLFFNSSNQTIQNAGGILRVGSGAIFQFGGGTTVAGGTLDGTGAFSGSLTLDGTASAVTQAGTHNLRAFEALTLRGAIMNHGLISIATQAVASALVRMHPDGATVGGSGMIRFGSPGNNILSGPGTGLFAPLRLLPGALVTTLPGAQGNMNGLIFTNEGRVESRGSGASVTYTGSATNTGIFAAAAGGYLALNGSNGAYAIENTGGTIRAEAGSSLALDYGIEIRGGLLDGAGDLHSNTGRLNGTVNPVMVTNTLRAAGGGLTLRGSIMNNGNLLTAHNPGTSVRVEGPVAISGNGAITFGGTTFCYWQGVVAADSLTLGAGQTWTTSAGAQGRIQGLSMVNAGTIEARGASSVLDLWAERGVTNNGVIRAAGGTLNVGNSAVNYAVENAGGVIRNESGAVVINATVRGGRLEGPGQVLSTAAVLDGTVNPVTVAGTVRTYNGGMTLRGSFVNNGNLLSQHQGQTVRVDGPVNLSGNGAFTFGGTSYSYLQGLAAADVLTLGAGQTFTTSPGGQGRAQGLSIVNAGTIEARGAASILDLWADRGVTNTGVIRAAAGGTLNFGDNVNSYSVNNAGGIIRNESGGMVLKASVRGGRIEGPSGITFNDGGAELDGTANPVEIAPNGVLGTNRGHLYVRGQIINNGRINLNRTSGAAQLLAKESLTLGGSGEVVFGTFAFGSVNILSQSGGAMTVTNGGTHTLRIPPGCDGSIQSSGFINAGTIVADGTLYGSTTTFTNGPTGVIRGNGSLQMSPVLANQGTIAPGSSPGALSITGNVTNSATAVFAAELGGTVSSISFDRLSVSGSFARGGALRPALINGFRPLPADSFLVLSAASLTGAWANVTGGKVTFEHGTFDVLQTATTVTLTNFTKNAAYTAYDTWMDGFPSLTGVNREPNADPDGDGFANVEEFGFGMNPAVPNGVPVTLRGWIDPGTGRFRVEFPRRKQPPVPYLNYQLQFSSDLITWTPHTPGPVAFVDIDTLIELVTFEDTLNPPANQRRFARIVIRLLP